MKPEDYYNIVILSLLLSMGVLAIKAIRSASQQTRIMIYGASFKGLSDYELISLIERIEDDEHRRAAKEELIRRVS